MSACVVQRSSQKAKGWPQDSWRAKEFGYQQYIHAIGFNVNEYTRITRDSAYSMGGQRIPTYPIYEWGWSRQDCIDYLYRELAVAWSKSCCRTVFSLLCCRVSIGLHAGGRVPRSPGCPTTATSASTRSVPVGMSPR